jgi:flagellar FliL protein
MSTAAVDAAPPPKGKKKLIIIIAAALAVVLGGGGAAMVMMKKSKADAEESADAEASDKPARKAVAKRDPKALPVFVPLEPFTVNLADRNADRYAQLAVTLELEDLTLEPQLKTFMPAIRNNILLAIADRTAGELMARDGKERLAQRIARETSRALGYDVPTEEEIAEAEAEAEGGDDEAPRKKKRRKVEEPDLPVRAVHFSNFIIQ